MFHLTPPTWTGAKRSAIGQTILLADVRRITKPHWPQPRWRAYDARPGAAPAPVRLATVAPAAPSRFRWGSLLRLVFAPWSRRRAG